MRKMMYEVGGRLFATYNEVKGLKYKVVMVDTIPEDVIEARVKFNKEREKAGLVLTLPTCEFHV